jgi:hypothetical protein
MVTVKKPGFISMPVGTMHLSMKRSINAIMLVTRNTGKALHQPLIYG